MINNNANIKIRNNTNNSTKNKIKKNFNIFILLNIIRRWYTVHENGGISFPSY